MTPLLNDDVALVIHPNMTNDKWNGTVDVQIVVMPIDKMSKDNLEEVFYIMQGLVAAFNLMNTDEAFAQRISQELERMAEAGELVTHTGGKDNVISIDQWTRTKGNA